jgi:hypothetical protein
MSNGYEWEHKVEKPGLFSSWYAFLAWAFVVLSFVLMFSVIIAMIVYLWRSIL